MHLGDPAERIRSRSGVLMTRIWHRLRRAEEGFSLIEVLTAAVILVVGTLFAFASLNSSTHLTYHSQAREAALGFAEQELENVRSMSYSQLGYASTNAPASSTDPNNPNYYTVAAGASGCTAGPGYQIESSYQAGGSPMTDDPCEMFANASNGVTGGAVPWTPQTISGYPGLNGGTYDVYVTWHYESGANNGCIVSTAICLGGAYEKRITVAVWPNGVSGTDLSGTGTRKPVWVTGIVTDPNAAALSLPG